MVTINEPTKMLLFTAANHCAITRANLHQSGLVLSDEQAGILEADLLRAIRAGFSLGVGYGGAEAGLVCEAAEPIRLGNQSAGEGHAFSDGHSGANEEQGTILGR